MASTPEFVKTPRINTVNVSSANTAIDGSGTITELIAGATGGTRVLEIVVKGAATSAAANVNIFLTTDGGSTYRLCNRWVSVTENDRPVTLYEVDVATTLNIGDVCTAGPRNDVWSSSH